MVSQMQRWSSFWEFSVCGILGWMFVGSHYEDVSLLFVLLWMIDR